MVDHTSLGSDACNTHPQNLLGSSIPLVNSDTSSNLPDVHPTSTTADACATTLNMEELDGELSCHLQRSCLITPENDQLHPTRRIPPEMLAKIFQHCADVDQHHENSVITSKSPWLVSQVCRAWREAALGAPLLWSNIRISHHPPKLFIHRIRLQLLRSRSCPLHIRVLSLPSHTSEDWAAIPQLLFSHCNRIEVLTLFDHGGGFLSSLGDLQQYRFPILRNLNFSYTYPTLDLFYSCPKLETVQFYGTSIISAHTLPWSQLIKLSCNPCDIRKMHGVLPLLKNVTQLRIYGSPQGSAPLGDLEPVRLCSVEQLSVEDSKYLRILTTPLLQDFTLAGMQIDSSKSPAILAFIARSRCRTTSFTFGSCSSSEVAIQLLDAVPEILSFCWTYNALDTGLRLEHVIEALSEPGDRRRCPNLENLTICDSLPTLPSTKPAPVDRILDMIKHRTEVKPGERTIKHVDLFNVGEIETWKRDTTMERVKSIREGGVELIARNTEYSDSGGFAVVNVA